MGCANQKLMKQEEDVIEKKKKKVSQPTFPAETPVKSEKKSNENPNRSVRRTVKQEKQTEQGKGTVHIKPSTDEKQQISSAGTTLNITTDEQQQAKTEDAEKTKRKDPTKRKHIPGLKMKVQEYLDQKRKLIHSNQSDIRATHSSEAALRAAADKWISVIDDKEPTESSIQSTSALKGIVDMVYPTDAKIVRIFTSSTFTDSEQERNYLMKFAYPEIKAHCRQIGYEFQVVDMRWGVRSEAADDHMTTELCLKELKLCQEVSTGPSFVSLLSHKYGYTSFPRVIGADEFESLMVNVEDEKTLGLFKKWYTRDDNAIPAEYVLSPISKYLPAFVGKQEKEKEDAGKTWSTESQTMQQALEQSAIKVFGENHARKFIMSVTETEVKEGLLDVTDPTKHCLWLKRDIVDIQAQDKDRPLSRFMECLGSEEKVTKAQTLLTELKENRMKKVLKNENILQYYVHWSKTGGINPEESDEHRKYLAKLSEDFIKTMISMIDKAVAEKSRTQGHIVNECMQHIKFCQLKCKNFYGRGETLEKIRQYVTSDREEKPPLVIHGQSGSGKTSILAMAAKLVLQWQSPKPLVILRTSEWQKGNGLSKATPSFSTVFPEVMYCRQSNSRFLGTTQDSSSLMGLLYSMTSQIEKCLGQPIGQPTMDIQEQTDKFWSTVHKYQAEKPLVIILDSLDQLDETNDARKLLWMPAKSAKGTILLSTLEEPQYRCFPALKQTITEPSNFINVPILSRESCHQILSGWFEMNKRQVTASQMNLLLNAFAQCSTPLFLKLSFDEAVRWTSYITEDEMVLCDTVRASIDHLFQRTEKLHGTILVSRALGYLTLAQNGASEVELEDLLSCDDDVLNDVYTHWTPPTRRLPPLLLVRIRSDLSEYLVERGADGVRVLYWYHRQFIEAAEARYCADPNTVQVIHKNLADFFEGAWADGKKKPFINSNDDRVEEDRFVSSQPLLFVENQYNLRKLNNLPFHCIKGGNVEMLLEKCLTNIDFLVTKIQAFDVISVQEDFKMANQTFPEKTLISAILDAMQLSQKGLKMDPKQLVPQMLQRLTLTVETSEFIQKCRDYTKPYLEPNKQLLDLSGGQLVNAIPACDKHIIMMDVSSDGKLILTAYQEINIILWSVEGGKQLRALQNSRIVHDHAYFCMNDKYIALIGAGSVDVEDVYTGSQKMIILQDIWFVCWCIAGKTRKLLVLANERTSNIYNLENNGEVLGTATLGKGERAFTTSRGDSIMTGSENYIAITDESQKHISVLDLHDKFFHKQFPVILDGDRTDKVGAICFTHDEKYLVFTNYKAEVLFTDLYGNVQRKIPGTDCGRLSFPSLALSPDDSQLFQVNGSTVYIYSTTTLQVIDEIKHGKDVTMVRSLNDKCIVTIADDKNIRIWDRTKKKLNQQVDTTTFITQKRVRSAMLLDNPRYILVCGDVQEDDKHDIIIVYDIFKEEAVREMKIMSTNDRQSYVRKILKTKTWNKVVMEISRRLHVLDLDTMSIVMTTDEKLGFYRIYCKDENKSRMLYSTNNEIVCVTTGSRNLTLYDQTTGKVNRVINTGQKQKMSKLTVSKSGNVACAETEDSFLLFDLVKGEHLYSIDRAKNRFFRGYDLLINAAGTILLISTEELLPELQEGYDLMHGVVWDIVNRKEIGRMYDIESEQKYIEFDQKYRRGGYKGSTCLLNLFELDEDRVVIDCLDGIFRIYDISTGHLLHRVPSFAGHYKDLLPEILIEDQSPYLLTIQGYEGFLRLFDKKTYQCLATFTFEKHVEKVSMSPDGKFFTTIMGGEEDYQLVIWRIHQSPHNSILNEADYPQAFKSKVVGFIWTESDHNYSDDEEIYYDDDDWEKEEKEEDDDDENKANDD